MCQVCTIMLEIDISHLKIHHILFTVISKWNVFSDRMIEAIFYFGEFCLKKTNIETILKFEKMRKILVELYR